jgi:hypothetical protein
LNCSAKGGSPASAVQQKSETWIARLLNRMVEDIR